MLLVYYTEHIRVKAYTGQAEAPRRKLLQGFIFTSIGTAGFDASGPKGQQHLGSCYNGTETVLSSSPFASVTSATTRPSFNDGVMLTA